MRVPGHGPAGAKVMIVGEFPDERATAAGKPFVGPAGDLLDRILGEVGLPRATCYVTNVCKYRPPGDKIEEWWTQAAAKAKRNALAATYGGWFYHERVAEGLAELPGEIAACGPEVIVAMGNLALWALTSEFGIGNWRGSELWLVPAQTVPPSPAVISGRCVPVIPTLHPTTLLRKWEAKAAVVRDFKARVLKTGSRAAPAYRFTVAASVAEVLEMVEALRELAAHQATTVAVDVETRRGRIACVGFGWSPLDALCCPLMHADGTRHWSAEDEARIGRAIRYLMNEPGVRLGNQNFNYDRQYFAADPVFDFTPKLNFDTMVAQHLIFPGTPKDLTYLSSMYCAHHAFWKDHENYATEVADEGKLWHLNCLDVVKTWEVDAAQQRVLAGLGYLQ